MKTLFTLFFGFMVCIAAHATTYTVAATNYAFTPANLSIHAGDVVHWTFSGTHDVTSGSNCTADSKFGSGTKNNGDTYDFTFATTGTFSYFCSFHCSMGMVGSITVTEASGIDENNISANILKCFPNPFLNKTTVSYELPSNNNVNISVTDMSGRSVLEILKYQVKGPQSEQIDMNAFPAGMYIINVNFIGIESKSMVLVKQ